MHAAPWFDTQYHHAVRLSPHAIAENLLAFLWQRR